MTRKQEQPVILKARKMQEQFRYEIARELGMTTADTALRGKLYNRTVITGAVPKRMVHLAEAQMRGDSL